MFHYLHKTDYFAAFLAIIRRMSWSKSAMFNHALNYTHQEVGFTIYWKFPDIKGRTPKDSGATICG